MDIMGYDANSDDWHIGYFQDPFSEEQELALITELLQNHLNSIGAKITHIDYWDWSFQSNAYGLNLSFDINELKVEYKGYEYSYYLGEGNTGWYSHFTDSDFDDDTDEAYIKSLDEQDTEVLNHLDKWYNAVTNNRNTSDTRNEAMTTIYEHWYEVIGENLNYLNYTIALLTGSSYADPNDTPEEYMERFMVIYRKVYNESPKGDEWIDEVKPEYKELLDKWLMTDKLAA